MKSQSIQSSASSVSSPVALLILILLLIQKGLAGLHLHMYRQRWGLVQYLINGDPSTQARFDCFDTLRLVSTTKVQETCGLCPETRHVTR